MTITNITPREFEIYATIDGKNGVYSKYPNNTEFARAFNFKTKIIRQNDMYCAFPYFVKLGSSIIGIYSEGAAHAQADRQIMSRSDDGGITFTEVIFQEGVVYNTSLIDDLISEGERVTLKPFVIKKVSGVVSVASVPTVSFGGENYALWSEVISFNGNHYRTGYVNGKTALFESTDNQDSWVYKSEIANDISLSFSESSLTDVSGNLVAIIREDMGVGNPLYKSTSVDLGVTWSTPALISSVNGRQPKVTKMTDGSYILSVGDRSGVSGVSANANSYFSDKTGVALYKSTDGLVTFGYKYLVDGIYSTDGGQPWAVEMSANRLFVPYYSRRDVTQQTGVYSCQIDTSPM